jgi:hypothetical protein
MYLISEDGRPFAIVENLIGGGLEKAIEEEFSYKDIASVNFSAPDWGNSVLTYYNGKDKDEGEEVAGKIEIMKLVNY